MSRKDPRTGRAGSPSRSPGKREAGDARAYIGRNGSSVQENLTGYAEADACNEATGAKTRKEGRSASIVAVFGVSRNQPGCLSCWSEDSPACFCQRGEMPT